MIIIANIFMLKVKTKIKCEKKRTNVANGFCELHYNGEDKYIIYNKIRCSFLNRNNKPYKMFI